MFKHLLVPLDGSKLAESVLPPAAVMAKILNARVTLVHVIEENPPSEIHGEPHLKNPDEAGKYLTDTARRAFPSDVHVEYHVHTTEVRNVAKSIAAHVGEFDTDLIILCTHGRGGLRDLLMGNIAQQVIAMGVTPVMIIRPTMDKAPASFDCKRLLVPLDGDPEHEQGLPVAANLARIFGTSMQLLMVVPTRRALSGRWAITRRLLPGATSEMLDLSVQDAKLHLQKHEAELKNIGLTVSHEVFRGDPAKIIAEEAAKSRTDLIVLGTHGKSGLDAFWQGSVASRICSLCRLPLLLVPLKKK